MRQETIDKLKESGWYDRLKSVFDSPEWEQCINQISNLYRTKKVYPEPPNILRAFYETKYNDCKVIILLQDPYHDGSATGIAMANENSIKISPSLEKFKDRIETDFHDGLLLDFDYSLLDYCKQGVLFLNTALTVEQKTPGSHTEIWKPVTKLLVREISSYVSGGVWILMGGKAREFEPYINKFSSNILRCEHPAAASYDKRQWNDSGVLAETNNILIGQNGPGSEIKW